MGNSKAQKIKDLLRDAVLSEPEAADASLAKTFCGMHRDLIRDWAVERLQIVLATVRREMKQAARPPDPYQIFLPGFRDFDERVYRKGGYTTLGGATIADLRKNLALERAKRSTSSRRKTKNEDRGLLCPRRQIGAGRRTGS